MSKVSDFVPHFDAVVVDGSILVIQRMFRSEQHRFQYVNLLFRQIQLSHRGAFAERRLNDLTIWGLPGEKIADLTSVRTCPI